MPELRPLLCLAALLTTTACSEVVTIDNAPPRITLQGLCQTDGRAYILVDAIDFERSDVDLRLTTAGGTIAPGPTGDGLRGLRTERGPEPVTHWIEWSAGSETIEGQGTIDPCAQVEGADLPGPAGGCALFTAGSEWTVHVYAFDEEAHDLGEQTLTALDRCP